ncbi:MAG: glutaminase A [Bdellovibrionaceae bacterium]|nr:glutaminase A [Pseudobdellovibrionaceae bacterium]
MNFAKACEILSQHFSNLTKNQDGQLASYIPELAKVDPTLFSASLVSIDGEIFSVGNTDQTFSLQSTSKPIVYSLALRELGSDFVHSKVGVEPTGEAFNSIIELEENSHRPFNPMINSGAIATTSLINGKSYKDKLNLIIDYVSELAGRRLEIDKSIFESERATAHRNRAIAYLMKHFDVMTSDVEETLALYFNQCSILVDTRDLALIAGSLANQGIHPLSKKQLISKDHTSKTLRLMFTCGMYDTAGEWAFRVGLPAKSGVSGAIFLVVPGQFGLAVYSPRIDQHGHSVRGRLLIENLVSDLDLNIFSKG